MACPSVEQLQAYYDGELPVQQRTVVEAHLAECGECRKFLAELAALSELVESAPMAQMPAGAIGRINQTWSRANDRGVLRIAGWLTTAAAAVLVGAVLSPRSDRGGMEMAAATPPLWQTVAAMSPEQQNESSRSDLVVLAQWMADDLSTPERQ
jgi:anti-sigma factor RsiW